MRIKLKKNRTAKTLGDFDNYLETYIKVQKYPQMQRFVFVIFKIKYVF
jgi:hypothetical protein